MDCVVIQEMSIKEEPEQRWAEVKKQIEGLGGQIERRKLDEIRERVRKKLELEKVSYSLIPSL